jgi:hypothetical protein
MQRIRLTSTGLLVPLRLLAVTCIAVTAVNAAIADAVLAQSRDENWKKCTSADPDFMIGGLDLAIGLDLAHFGASGLRIMMDRV